MARLSALAVLLLLVPGAALAGAGRLGGGGELNVSLARVVLALLFCLMVAGVAVLLIKRGGGRIDLGALRGALVRLPAARRIEVIETRRVSQHADICLFRCGGREYLVLCTAQQQTVLRDSEVACGVEALA